MNDAIFEMFFRNFSNLGDNQQLHNPSTKAYLTIFQRKASFYNSFITYVQKKYGELNFSLITGGLNTKIYIATNSQ